MSRRSRDRKRAWRHEQPGSPWAWWNITDPECVHFTQADCEAFIEIMLEDVVPNERLLAAVDRYRREQVLK